MITRSVVISCNSPPLRKFCPFIGIVLEKRMEILEENNLEAILDAVTNFNDFGRCVTLTITEESTHDELSLQSPLTEENRRNIRPRKRPNTEIKYLRDQVVELEVLLATLHDSAQQPQLLQVENILERNRDYWKLCAETNKRNTKAALLENRKLRGMLDDRLRVAKAYQNAIDKHVRLMARKLPWLSCINAKTVPDELIFAQLDAEKEYQFAAIDEILEVSGIARVKHEFLSRLCFQQGSFHHTEVRVLPFSVSDVTRAIQNCLAQRESTEQHRCRKLIRFYNHFKAVTVDKVQVPGACPAEVTARLLQWCVVQPERTVVTWSCFFEYDGSRYVRLFEKIWVSIEPIRLKQNSTFSGQYGSILRIVVHLTPVEIEFDLDDIEEMAEVVIASYHRNAEMIYQALLAQLAP